MSNVEKPLTESITEAKTTYQALIEAEQQHQLRKIQLWNDTNNQLNQMRYTDLKNLRAYIENCLDDEEYSTNQRVQLEINLHDVKEKQRKQEVAEAKKSNDKILADYKKLQADLRSSTLSFAMNEPQYEKNSIGLGDIKGLQNITSAIKNVEKESFKLTGMIPNANTFEISGLRNNAFEIANLSGQAIGDVQKIQQLWAGTSDEIANNAEALKYLTRVTSIAINVGSFDNAEQAVQLLNATINQMGLDWRDASMIMDSWVKTADRTAIHTAKELASNITEAGTQARALGLGIYDLNGIAGMFANNMSESGQDIGTAMKTMFSYFLDEKAIKVLETYGVHVKKNATEYNNLHHILQQLEDTYKRLEVTNNQAGTMEINNVLGRNNSVDYVGMLLNHGNEASSISIDSIDSLGYAMKQNEAVTESYESKLTQLNNTFVEMAWGIGESGLLDDMKAFISGSKSGVDWFNQLDPMAKSLVRSLLEVYAAMTVVNKASKLLFNMEGNKAIGNMVANIGLKLQNQKIVDMGVRAGATLINSDTMKPVENPKSLFANTSSQQQNNITKQTGAITSAKQTIAEGVETAVIKAQTGAIEKNTIEQAKNNVAEQTGAITSAEQTIAEGLETTAIKTQKGAIEANTIQQTKNTAAKVGSAGVTTALGTAIGELVNPITAAIAVIGLMVTALIAYKDAQKQAAEEAKAFAAAQESLEKKLDKKLVSDSEVSLYESELNKLEEAQKKMQIANDKIAALKKEQSAAVNKATKESQYGDDAISSNKIISAANLNAGEIKALQDEVNSLNKELKSMGATTDSLNSIMERYKVILENSTNPTIKMTLQTGMLIEEQLNSQKKLREQISDYERLRAGIKSTGDVTEEFKNLTQYLSMLFPQSATEINNVTGIWEINTDIIKEHIGVLGDLTDAQLAEIAMTANLDATGKQHALDYYKNEIEMTKSKQTNTTTRLGIMLGEMNALAAMMDSGNYSDGDTIDAEKKYWRMMNDPEVKAYYDNLKLVEAIYKSIAKINPYSGADTGIPPAGGGEETYIPKADRYLILNSTLEKLGSEYDKLKILEDMLNDPDKLVFIKRETNLIKEKQTALNELNNEHRSEKKELEDKLKLSGFKFDDKGNISNYQSELVNHTGDAARDIEAWIARLTELNTSLIPETSNKWWELQTQIKSLGETALEIKKKFSDELIENVKSTEERVVEIVKKRIEEEYKSEKQKIEDLQKAEDKRHKDKIESLEKEKKEHDKVIDAILKEIDIQENQRNYDNQLSELEMKRQNLVDDYNSASLDTSDSGKSRAQELRKQIEDKDKEIEELKYARELELRKQSLQANKEAYQEDYENKVETENSKHEAAKKRLEDNLKDIDMAYEKKLEKDSLYQEAYKIMISSSYEELAQMMVNFENQFGNGMSMMGTSIKDNLISNLKEALGLMKAVGYTGGGNLDSLLNRSTQNTDEYVNMLLYQQTIAYNIARKNNDSKGMTDAHTRAEAIREQYSRPLSADGGADLIYQKWLRDHGLNLDATSMNGINFNNVISGDINKILADTPIPSSDLLKTSINTSSTGNLSVGSLVNIDGNVASDKLSNVKEFANLVMAQVWEGLKQKGVL